MMNDNLNLNTLYKKRATNQMFENPIKITAFGCALILTISFEVQEIITLC